MNTKLKKGLKIVGVVVAVIAIYAGAVMWNMWKWESPHDPLPENHLAKREHQVMSEGLSTLADAVNAAMHEVASELQSVSMSGALAIGGEQIWAGAVGLADVENGIPANIESRYRIGSVSKAVTATAVAHMVEAGLLDFDDEVQKFLPDYPRYETPMTVRQLLSHMSGIRHYEMNPFYFPPSDYYLDEHYDDVLEATTFFQSDGLEFPPGQGFQYSTYGYTLLSALMQEAADQPFLAVMDDYLFNPLGMDDTMAELPGRVDHLVNFYTSDDGLYGATREVDMSIKWAGGGFVSTPSDMVRLGNALLRNEFLSRETRDEMFAVQPMSDGSENPQAYALGWRHHETINILGEENPVDVVHHGGTAMGGVAFLLLVPDHNISIALLTNGAGDLTRREIQMLAYRMAALAIEQQEA